MTPGASSRRKGATAERYVAGLYRDVGAGAERCLVETREGNVGDIDCSLPLAIQVKSQQNPSVWRALAEAELAAGEGEYAIAHVHRARGRGHPTERIVAMSESDWMEIVGALVRERIW